MREVFYNILIEIDIPMKLFRLIKVCFIEICSKVWICKCLSCTHFLLRTVRHKVSLLSPLVFNFALDYAIGMVQANQEGLNWDGTHQFLVCGDDNLLVKKYVTIKKRLYLHSQ